MTGFIVWTLELKCVQHFLILKKLWILFPIATKLNLNLALIRWIYNDLTSRQRVVVDGANNLGVLRLLYLDYLLS